MTTIRRVGVIIQAIRVVRPASPVGAGLGEE